MKDLYLVGDEDTGVGLECSLCDRGGLPLAYYPGISGNPYTSQGVPTCETIESLIDQMRIHLRVVHG